MRSHETHFKRAVVFCSLFLGWGLVFLSCSKTEDQKAARSLLDLYKKDQWKEKIGQAVNRSPVIWFFRSLDIHCDQTPERKICTSSREKPLHEFIVNGIPTQAFLDLYDQLTTICAQNPDQKWGCSHDPMDHHSPQRYRTDFSFLFHQFKTIQQDKDLILLIQYQKTYCETYPNDGKFCTELYPIDSQPVNKINDEHIYPEPKDLLNKDYW